MILPRGTRTTTTTSRRPISVVASAHCAGYQHEHRTPNTEREACTLRVRPIMGRQSDHSVGSGSARRGLSRLTLRSRDCDQAGHTDIGEMTHTHGLVACRLISEGCRLARSKWHFPALVEQYRHDVPGRRPANGSSQPGPANTNAAGRRFRPLLSGASGFASVGLTVHAESAMRFCRLRAMHQPELLADEPRFVFWTVRRRVCNTGPRYADGQGRRRRRRE